MKKNQNLNKGIGPIATGLAMGTVVGTAVYMMSNKKSTNSTSKTVKRTAGKALRAVGTVMEKIY